MRKIVRLRRPNVVVLLRPRGVAACQRVVDPYESALTESGRVRGTFHDMILRTAVLEGAFERHDVMQAPLCGGASQIAEYIRDLVLERQGRKELGGTHAGAR